MNSTLTRATSVQALVRAQTAWAEQDFDLGEIVISENLTLTGRITSLFDEEYSDVWGYAARGRAANIGLSATF